MKRNALSETPNRAMPTSLFDHIDLYCERLDAGLWAEPLNALSNLVFIIAGLWGVREVTRQRTGGFALLLAWWVVAIGVGSLAFHTFATRLTIWGDIVPIAGFTLAYTLFNLRRFLGYFPGATASRSSSPSTWPPGWSPG